MGVDAEEPSRAGDEADGLARALAAIERGRVSLALDTTDLCFLVALRARAERAGLASFEEELLVEVFEERLEQLEPGAASPRKRATHAIQRLRDQRLLARVDGAGVVAAGEFALTRLAVGIVDFFLADELLTRESLSLLTKILREQLVACRAAARKAGADEGAWAARVVQPLRVLVGDLLTGIERRQRGLDAQQEEVVAEVERLLREDWFASVTACEELLERTSATLRELHDVLLQDTTHLSLLLQELEALATKARQAAALEAIRAATEHVERVGAWGGARLKTWSGYYQHVHGFLRDVVRLDPERALSQRLRDRVAGFLDLPFGLFVAAEPSIRLLREELRPVARPPVARPRADRGLVLEEVAPADDPDDVLAARARAALDAGAASLSQVLARVLPAVPAPTRYRAAGRVAGVVADAAGRRLDGATPRVRPWVEVPGELLVEEWTLSPAPARPEASP